MNMWYELLEVGQNWSSLWAKYVRCSCGGIRTLEKKCPACGEPTPNLDWSIYRKPNGSEIRIPQSSNMGAEGRYEDWIYLEMLEHEWMRPISDKDRFLNISENNRPSPKAIVVLIFWTYFETKLERIFTENMGQVPERITEELLQRYSSVGSRLDRLYKIIFSTTYWTDLNALGYSNIVDLLKRVQQSRNDFAHGHPEAINDSLVMDLVAGIRDEHESWIAVFNRRIRQRVDSKT